MKLNLGGGNSHIEGYTSVDLYDTAADVMADICELPYSNNSVEAIVAYQVVEHVPYWKSEDMFREMYRVLKTGCSAIIETPDIGYIAKQIADTGEINQLWINSLVGEYYRPWDKDRYQDWDNCAAAIHRNPWNEKRIRNLVEPMGFKVKTHTPKVIDVPENLSLELIKWEKHL